MVNRKETIIDDSRGFTLIEVLLAMGILAIGLMGVLSLHLHSSRFNTDGNVATTANMVARQFVEDVSVKNLDDIRSMNGTERKLGFDGKPGSYFTVTTIVSDYRGKDGSEGSFETVRNVLRVDVHVSWQRNGSTQSINYSTITRGDTIEI